MQTKKLLYLTTWDYGANLLLPAIYYSMRPKKHMHIGKWDNGANFPLPKHFTTKQSHDPWTIGAILEIIPFKID